MKTDGPNFYNEHDAYAAQWLRNLIAAGRIAPRELDSHDNLRHGFKGPVDAIAAWLGVKDSDPRVTWQYEQMKGKPKQYAMGLEIQPPLLEMP